MSDIGHAAAPEARTNGSSAMKPAPESEEVATRAKLEF